jgi:hypothetical protein
MDKVAMDFLKNCFMHKMTINRIEKQIEDIFYIAMAITDAEKLKASFMKKGIQTES